MRRITRLLAAVALVCIALPAQAELELWQFRTEFLRAVYYSQQHELLVPHMARSFENSLGFHRQLFDWTPSEPIVVLMQDFGDFGHGGTSTVPWNYISIGIEPFDYIYDTMPANERLNWLMHHELVHVVATDKATRGDARWRTLFAGKVAPTAEQPISMLYSWMTSPRWYAPRWYHEGIAVFLETWMSGGMGRVLGGYDEMVFRTMILEDRPFYEVVGLESEGTAIDFQVGQNSYLYGTRFVTWLALTHGPDQIVRWFDRSEGSARSIATQFERVYGEPLSRAWSKWIAWEREWQTANLARVRKYAVTQDRPVTSGAIGSVSRAFVDPAGRTMYAAVNYPGRPAHIAAISLDDGTERSLTPIDGPALYFVTSLAYDPDRATLFFTTDNSGSWRDLNALDLATGRTRRLSTNARAGDLVVNRADHSLWAVQHHNGLATIVRFLPPFDTWQALVTLPYGHDIFALDLSPDGTTLVATMIDIAGTQRIVRAPTEKIAAGEAAFEPVYEFQNSVAESFVFSADGKSLYGTSYFTGVSNIYRIDVASKSMAALTNAESGYFRPVPLADGSLVAFRFTAQGFRPVRITPETREDIEPVVFLGQKVIETYPKLRDWNVGSPLKVDLAAVKKDAGRYRPLREFRFASWYPVIEGYKNNVAAGVRANLADPLSLHNLSVTITASPDPDLPSGERFHAKARWDHFPWSIRAGHNATDFYDLFGPTKTSRKGSYLAVEWERPLLDERPRNLTLSFSAAGYSGLDRLPAYQNVPATFDSYYGVSGGLSYRKLRNTIGGVEPERGVAVSVGLDGDVVKGDLIERASTSLDIGVPLPIDHSSLWLRGAAGYSWGDPLQTFSNFYFGGFGNNWVDHGSVRRYRDAESFPGAEINEFEANNYGKLTLEWMLPPVRFTRLGAPSFYANWMHAGLFVQGLTTNPWGSLGRREFLGAGAQVDFKIVIFTNLESTLSLGWAAARENGESRGREAMVSLKILR